MNQCPFSYQTIKEIFAAKQKKIYSKTKLVVSRVLETTIHVQLSKHTSLGILFTTESGKTVNLV